MTQRDFFRLWFRLRPRDFSRSKWYDLGDVIHWTWGTVTMPVRNPRLWIFCRTVELATAFDLPLPKWPEPRGVLKA